MDMNTLSNEQLLDGFMRDMQRLHEYEAMIQLNLQPEHAMALIGAIQLACRHPRFTGPSRKIVEAIIENIGTLFAQYNVPHITESIRRGNDQQFDVPAQSTPAETSSKAKMQTGYKLPKCWIGKSMNVMWADGTTGMQVITEADVNLKCHCEHELQAFFCGEGHMLECHVGMTCEEAECSHLERYDPPFHTEDDL